MKKILAAVLIAALTFGATVAPTDVVKAQASTTYSRTITAADTITFSNLGSKLRGWQYTYTETSGTTAGKVYLEGNINGNASSWIALDSMTLADQAAAQVKTITYAPTAGTLYKNYRWRNTNTSSATGAVVVTALRRPDE